MEEPKGMGAADSPNADNAQPTFQKRFVRSLRLPSDSLKALGLRKGMNEVRFSVTTKFQGTSWCMCHVYLWDWCDKIVISDIDGTITKSDVLGHIMPVIGGTWAHNGVAELYTGIKNNGSVSFLPRDFESALIVRLLYVWPSELTDHFG